MNAIYRLYSKDNPTMPKSINIDDSLYEKLKELIDTKFDATISDIINVAFENYIEKNKPSFYAKPKDETVTYRTVMIRRNNLVALQGIHLTTGISLTRLVNSAIKDFLDNIDNL